MDRVPSGPLRSSSDDASTKCPSQHSCRCRDRLKGFSVIDRTWPLPWWDAHRRYAAKGLQEQLIIYRAVTDEDTGRLFFTSKLNHIQRLKLADIVENAISGIYWLIDSYYLALVTDSKDSTPDEMKLFEHIVWPFLRESWKRNGFAGHPRSEVVSLRSSYAGLMALLILRAIAKRSSIAPKGSASPQWRDELDRFVDEITVGERAFAMLAFLEMCRRRDANGFLNVPSNLASCSLLQGQLDNAERITEPSDPHVTLHGLALLYVIKDFIDDAVKNGNHLYVVSNPRKAMRDFNTTLQKIDLTQMIRHAVNTLSTGGLPGTGYGLGERHAAYTYCSLASISLCCRIIGEGVTPEYSLSPNSSAELIKWLNGLTGHICVDIKDGYVPFGFRSRANASKLDSCYSWWVGASLALLHSSFAPESPEITTSSTVEDRHRMVFWSQHPEGGICKARKVNEKMQPGKTVQCGCTSQETSGTVMASLFESCDEPFEIMEVVPYQDEKGVRHEPLGTIASRPLQYVLASDKMRTSKGPDYTSKTLLDDHPPDAFHTFFGLNALLLTTRESELTIDAALCSPHLNSLR